MFFCRETEVYLQQFYNIMIIRKIIPVVLTGLVILGACTKKETIVQEYNPPQPKLYGNWKVISTNLNGGYFSFPNDGNNFAYILGLDEDGFKNKEVYAYSATDKQLIISGTVFNYNLKGDTLILKSSPSSNYMMVKTTDPNINASTWLSSTSIAKDLGKLPNTSSDLHSIGIDGNTIYYSGLNGMGNYVYKYNTSSKVLEDSIASVNTASHYYKSGTLYYGFDYMSNKIFKGTPFAPVTSVSSNNLSSVRTVSANASSGVIYAFTSSGEMYTGTENSTFNILFDFQDYNVASVTYYKNDEFLCVKNSTVHRVKISPDFQVLATYEMPESFNAYTVSTNGTDMYVFGYDSNANDYKLIKLNF